MAALRPLLAKELDRAENRQGIEVFEVAFIAIAKVEVSKDDDEAEKPLTELAWEVGALLLKYFKKEKLAWINENYDKLRSSAYNAAAVKAIFGRIYHNILEDRVITPLEERLITLFIQQGLTTSIVKKGEILFQGVRYEIEGFDIKFMLGKIARIIIGMDQDLLAKQYKTNTPIFEKSYQDGGIQKAAVDNRKIISVVDTKYVLRNDYWVLTHLKAVNTDSEMVLLEQRNAFGDHVVYKLEEEGGSFKELQESFTLEDVFGKYHPGLTFVGRSKILASKAGQELVKGTVIKFEDIRASQGEESVDFYYHQELLKMGRDDRVIRTLNQKASNPLRALKDRLDELGLRPEVRELLQQYYEGFISTFSSVYMVSTNVNSSTFNIKEIEAEMTPPLSLFTKLVGLIPYGIGEKISGKIVEALNYVENNKFKNNNNFIVELAIDPVDLSDWVSGVVREKLESFDKRQQIINAKEEDTKAWVQQIQAIQNAITKMIEQWKSKLTLLTGENNLFAKEIQKSFAFRLGQSEANQMISEWFDYCHGLGEGEWKEMSREERRSRFTQKRQNNQRNTQANQEEEEINNNNNPVNLNNLTNKKEVNKVMVTVEDELPNPDPKKPGGSCEECNIF